MHEGGTKSSDPNSLVVRCENSSKAFSIIQQQCTRSVYDWIEKFKSSWTRMVYKGVECPSTPTTNKKIQQAPRDGNGEQVSYHR